MAHPCVSRRVGLSHMNVCIRPNWCTERKNAAVSRCHGPACKDNFVASYYNFNFGWPGQVTVHLLWGEGTGICRCSHKMWHLPSVSFVPPGPLIAIDTCTEDAPFDVLRIMTVHVGDKVYGRFYWKIYGNIDACASSVYQALSPPLKGPGYEAN